MWHNARMHYWLFKTEPTGYSIDDLKRDKMTAWTGVRNYQARNMLRDDIKKGDLVIFYHSSCEIPGAYGIAEVVKEGYADETQFDTKSKYYDPKATKDKPQWFVVDIKFKEKFKDPVPLADMRLEPALQDMALLRPGQRLSLFPISKRHYEAVLRDAGKRSSV
jgi:predicted RNA-binding protein with PUA-like domain